MGRASFGASEFEAISIARQAHKPAYAWNSKRFEFQDTEEPDLHKLEAELPAQYSNPQEISLARSSRSLRDRTII